MNRTGLLEPCKDTSSSSGSQTSRPTQLNGECLPINNDDLLRQFSDLTDRYWSGSKSLLRNQRFRGQFL